MQIETDKVQIKSGVRFSKTTGAPVCLEINNKSLIFAQIKKDIV